MVDGGGGGGGGGGYGGAAPVVNINLDEVKNAINAVKNDTNEIKEALSEQGKDIKDIKVSLKNKFHYIAKLIIICRQFWKVVFKRSQQAWEL